MFDIKGKTAIVTGGASGIGLSTVEALLRKGANVVMSDINEQNLHIEGTRLTLEYPMMITTKVTDVSDPEAVKELVDFAVETFGSVDIMVANAGVGVSGSSIDLGIDTYKWTLGINLDGVYYSDIEAIKQIKKQGTGGAVINVSSILGMVGDNGTCFYNTSKFGVRGMTKALALEFAENNIRVNSVHPGYIITGMVNEQTMGAEGLAFLESKHPLTKGIGRLGEPEEIAHAIIFAIENTFLTGQEIVVDGGYIAQ